MRQSHIPRTRTSRSFPASGHPSNGLITHALQTIGDESGLRVYLERVFFEDNVLEFDWMVLNRLQVGLLSEATGGRLEQAPRYRELVGPEGFGYEMRGAFSTGTQLWGGLALWREKGRPDFTAREVAFVQRVASHIAAGLRAATSNKSSTTIKSATTQRGFWSSIGGGRWCSTTRRPNSGCER